MAGMLRIHALGFIVVALVLCVAPCFVPAAENIPTEISNADFWRMVSDFSEEDGHFPFDNFMSNEDSYQSVISTLQETTKPGGVYIGVGPEQNFTYIAAFQPQIAFILDIRRQNMLEHLIYIAVFELSKDRAEFVSMLFSRRRPAGLKWGQRRSIV